MTKPAAPQTVGAPLTRAAIFLVVTVNPGAAARPPCGRLRRSGRPAALGRVSRARRTPVLHHGVRVGRMGSPVRSAEAGRTAPVPGNSRRRAPRRRHARRPAVPHSRRADGSVLRARDPDHDATGRCRVDASTRCTASAISTPATCWASSMGPKTRAARRRSTPR